MAYWIHKKIKPKGVLKLEYSKKKRIRRTNDP